MTNWDEGVWNEDDWAEGKKTVLRRILEDTRNLLDIKPSLVVESNLSDLENAESALDNLGAGEAGKALFCKDTHQSVIDYLDLPPPPEGPPYSSADITTEKTDPLRITIGNVTNPARFGTWDRTGNFDSTAALTTALASNRFVEMGDGNFRLNTKAVIASGQKHLIGAGPGITYLHSYSVVDPCLEIAPNLHDVIVEGFTVHHVWTPVAPSANGINVLGNISTSKIKDIAAIGNWSGLYLSSTGYSKLEGVFCSNNLHDGIYLTTAGSWGAAQWYMDDILSQANGRAGLYVAPSPGHAGMMLGDWSRIRTFANNSFGIAVNGTSWVPVHGFRLHESFLGTDGNSEIYLNTFGFGHRIHDVFCEITGTGYTGPSLSTPPSGAGWGVLATANNIDVHVSECYFSGCSQGGIYSEAEIDIVNNVFKYMTSGFNVADGSKLLVSGNRMSGVSAPATILSNAHLAVMTGNRW